jgi:hypothetical protein
MNRNTINILALVGKANKEKVVYHDDLEAIMGGSVIM